MLSSLDFNKEDKESVLSKCIVEFEDEIKKYVKNVEVFNKVYIKKMATLCGFEKVVAVVFCCFSYYYRLESKKISGKDPRAKAYLLAKDLFNKKLNKVKSLEELDKLIKNFDEFKGYFVALFSEYSNLETFASTFKETCDAKKVELRYELEVEFKDEFENSLSSSLDYQ